jgi:copper chaperone
MTQMITVYRMSCEGCEQNVEDALQDLEGVTQANADHNVGTVEIRTEHDISDTDIHAAVESAGYTIE